MVAKCCGTSTTFFFFSAVIFYSIIATTSSFTIQSITTVHPTYPILSSLLMKNDENSLDQTVLESQGFHLRRQFVSYAVKSIAALSVGLVGGEIDEASAALNNRLGKLPNKIRDVCLIMVSSSQNRK